MPSSTSLVLRGLVAEATSVSKLRKRHVARDGPLQRLLLRSVNVVINDRYAFRLMAGTTQMAFVPTGKVVRIPAMPLMYDHEYFPQDVGILPITGVHAT